MQSLVQYDPDEVDIKVEFSSHASELLPLDSSQTKTLNLFFSHS